MPDYVKLDIETMDYRDGTTYIEFVDRIPTRQVTHVDGRWSSATPDDDMEGELTDQLQQPGEFESEDFISGAEFEEAWNNAMIQKGKS